MRSRSRSWKRLGERTTSRTRRVVSRAPAHAAGSGVGPPWWLLLVPLLLTPAYLFVATSSVPGAVTLANFLGPSVLGLTAAIAGFQVVRRSPESVWTPYAWFLVAVLAFYCAGPLVHSVAGVETRRLASTLYHITPRELLRTNLLDAVGVLGVLLGVRLAGALPLRLETRGLLNGGRSGRRPSQASERVRSGTPSVGAEVAALTLLTVGGILRYLVILPVSFGFVHVIVPGVIWNLGGLHLLGIAVLAYVVASGERRWRLLLVVLWTLQVVVSALLFSKHELVFSIALPALGGYAAHRRLRRLLAWGLVVAAVYVSVPQLVAYGREQVYRDTGAINRAGLATRAAIVERWFARGRSSLIEGASSGSMGWARLDYAPFQAFAMDRYDHGYAGETLRYAGIVLMPRLLWPKKPVTTDLGVDFYELMTGRRSTHLGLGIFGEGYWNLGWPGVVGLSLVTGMIFAVIGGLSVGWIRRREFLYLPGVALGIQMGAVGTTQTFANSIVGGSALVGLYTVTAWLIVRVLAHDWRHRIQGSVRTTPLEPFDAA